MKNKTVPSCFSPLFLSHDQLLLIVQNSGQYHLLMETFCPCPAPPCILVKPLTHFSEEHSQFYPVNKQQSIYSIELSGGGPCVYNSTDYNAYNHLFSCLYSFLTGSTFKGMDHIQLLNLWCLEQRLEHCLRKE